MCETAVTVGMFDGVHLGHRDLLGHLRAHAAARGLQPVAVTFDRHPLELIAPAARPTRLTGNALRRRLLEETGVRVVELPFTPALRAMPAAAFMTMLEHDLRCRLLLAGHDHTLGHDLLSGAAALKHAAPRTGMDIIDAPVCRLAGGELPSSSAIRAALGAGDLPLACNMLGRPYSVAGTVIHGRGQGRTLGFATANVDTAPGTALPADGVYAVMADGQPAVANLGTCPTLTDGSRRTLEVHLLDPPADTDLYGLTMDVTFVKRLRGEQRFDSPGDLAARIALDKQLAIQILKG